MAARRSRSRIGAKYVPEAATEQNYATQVSFRYTVSTLSGFSLAGTPDTGTFFAIEPAQMDDPRDRCSTHSREAFRDTVKYLGLTLFVDFPNDPADCHKTDPQIARSTRAEAGQGTPSDRMTSLWLEPAAVAETASVPAREITLGRAEILANVVAADPVAHYLTAAMYLFHASGTACLAPILFLTTAP